MSVELINMKGDKVTSSMDLCNMILIDFYMLNSECSNLIWDVRENVYRISFIMLEMGLY